MKTLTHSEFAKKLAERPGAVILGIIATTDTRAKKTGNPFGEILKRSHLTVVTGAKYEDAVKKQGGDGFRADGLPYGTVTVGNKVIKTDTGKLQLRTVYRNAPKPVSIEYIADGIKVAKELVAKFLPEKKASAKQAAVGVTGKKEVRVRNFDFANISEVRMGGEQFKLIPD